MLEWFTNILNMWQFIFINGFIDYLGVQFTGPLIGNTFGNMGAYLESGLIFTAKQAAQTTSYFSSMGGSLSSMWGGSGRAGGSKVGM